MVFGPASSHCRTVRGSISRPRTTEAIVAVEAVHRRPEQRAEGVADGQGDPARLAVMLTL